jgi:hypothetical protein
MTLLFETFPDRSPALVEVSWCYSQGLKRNSKDVPPMSALANNASHRVFIAGTWRKFVASFAIIASLPLPAQILKTGQEGSPKLFITVLEGEGALNNIRQRDAREPVVQVTDENHKPVAVAVVLFLIHDGGNGATATFNGVQTFSATTGPDGIARTTGLQVGRNPGSYTITVSASLGAVVAEQVIMHQSNVITPLTSATSESGGAAASKVATHGILHMSKTVAIVAGSAVVVGAVVAAVVVTQGSSSTSLTLGASTVGHP